MKLRLICFFLILNFAGGTQGTSIFYRTPHVSIIRTNLFPQKGMGTS